jgi:hypothetical protein
MERPETEVGTEYKLLFLLQRYILMYCTLHYNRLEEQMPI